MIKTKIFKEQSSKENRKLRALFKIAGKACNYV